MTTLKPKVQIKLKKHEHIIAVVPEYCDVCTRMGSVLRLGLAVIRQPTKKLITLSTTFLTSTTVDLTNK